MTATRVALALTNRAEDIALSLLGRSTSISRREMRWGRRGSRCLTLVGEKRGLWFDHERGIGGDMLDLIADVRGTGRGEAIRIAEKEFFSSSAPTPPRPVLAVSLPSDDEAKAERITLALQIWREGSALSGTRGESASGKCSAAKA